MICLTEFSLLLELQFHYLLHRKEVFVFSCDMGGGGGRDFKRQKLVVKYYSEFYDKDSYPKLSDFMNLM